MLLEARGYLAGCLVGERESADARRIESALVYKKPNSLDEAVSFSCAGSRQNQKWLRLRLDCSAL